MSKPQIHGRRSSFSVSRAVDQLGEDIARIREEDGLTWADVGRVLGKSDDRAADYAKGLSEMSFTAFLLGCREWNGRFSGSVMGMIGQRVTDLNGGSVPHRHLLSLLTRLAFEISVALEDDEEIDDTEFERLESLLDDVTRGLDALRQRRTGATVSRIGGGK